MTLLVRGGSPASVFGLIGSDENSATFALGWLLERSATFRFEMVARIFGQPIKIDGPVITLQTHAPDGGFTDLEFHAGGRLHLILEAKRSRELPTLQQLARYRPRFAGAGAALQRLVSVGAMATDQARRRLPKDLDGVTVTHVSWRDLQQIAKRAFSQVSGYEEKLWLRQFIEHLREFVAMDRTTSNLVYVVSLGSEAMVEGQSHTWIDVVERDRCYFHPIGPGWPSEPPNYMGFRYRGQLQSVHHVDTFEVVANVATINGLWVETNVDHFVYRLGPPIRPASEVRTGNIYRNGRVRCAIDTLLSGAFPTISAARDETKRREAELG